MEHLTHLCIQDWPLALEVYSLSNQMGSLDIFIVRRVLDFIDARSPLMEQI